jgi:hypothetical protein
MDASNVMKNEARMAVPRPGRCTELDNKSHVTLTSVYVPYTCRNASQISPTVA